MTPEQIKEAQALVERLDGYTPGPWSGHNMVHEEGRQMTPEELGEYVCNSVKMGDLSRFLFVSGKHDDGGDCDVCHTGNGPRGPANTALIAAAPDLHAALTAALDQIEALEAENAAGLRREKDANERAMKHLRRAEKAEIASKNHAAFSRKWRERAERIEAENVTLRTEKHADAEAIGALRAERDTAWNDAIEAAAHTGGAENARLREAALRTAAALAAAIRLLERGGKKAAPSDRMFTQMLIDYRNALETARAALATQESQNAS